MPTRWSSGPAAGSGSARRSGLDCWPVRAARSTLFHARLIARHGRGDEAFSLLQPHIQDWSIAVALTHVADSAGRDDEAATLLAAQIPDEHRCDDPWCCRGFDADMAIGLLATIRER
ncbi:hypothetical protein ACIQVC_25825 [Streptomyces sp. NPDC101112]|uniref:hypothetical protein n=1 Tax=Streptomyces sp. NPDC101112 TaxID=3366105 RepID=UPI0038113710